MVAMRRFAALVVAGATLLSLPACGEKTDETTRSAGVTPVNALAFVSLNLDPSIEQQRNLLAIARRFPGAGEKAKGEFESARDEAIADLLEDSGLDFARDVKPWLGNEVALAVLPAGRGRTPYIVAMVETGDEAKARAAVDKAAAAGDFEGAYSVVDDFVLLSDQEDEAGDQAALDLIAAQARKDDGGLARSEAFTTVVDELAGDRLLLAWADVKSALEQAGDATGVDQLGLLAQFGDAETAGVDVHAESDAVVAQAVAKTPGGGKGGAVELTRTLPGTTLAALTLFDLGTGITEGLSGLFGAGGPDFAGQFESVTGIDLEADILSWMEGEVVFVAGDVPEDQFFPQFGLVVEVTDEAKARSGVAKVRAALDRQGLEVEEREVAGQPATVAPELRDGIRPAMGLYPGRFVLASRPEFLAQLAKAESPGLAGLDAYESVLEDDDDVIGQFVLLIDPIREAIERGILSDPGDKAEYERDVKPNLEPLAAFGIVARRDGDLARVTLKLTFD
jgi:hypothetical protein